MKKNPWEWRRHVKYGNLLKLFQKTMSFPQVGTDLWLNACVVYHCHIVYFGIWDEENRPEKTLWNSAWSVLSSKWAQCFLCPWEIIPSLFLKQLKLFFFFFLVCTIVICSTLKRWQEIVRRQDNGIRKCCDRFDI